MAKDLQTAEPKPTDFRYRIIFDQVGVFREGDVVEWYEVASDLTALAYALKIGSIEQTTDKRSVGSGPSASTLQLTDALDTIKAENVQLQKDKASLTTDLQASQDELETLRGQVEDLDWLNAKLSEIQVAEAEAAKGTDAIDTPSRGKKGTDNTE